MASNSNIEWTDTTWNPLAGCTRASEGCDHCYAAVMSLRLEAMAQADIDVGKDPGRKAKYIGIATKNRLGIPAFNGKINLDYEALKEPLRWKKPRLVFVNSMSDLFHRDVPFVFVAEVFATMELAPQHTYQVLTKRPERMLYFQRQHYPDGLPANVWVGTSVEDQETADLRIPHLLKVKAAVRYLSMEPLLGRVLLDGECFHGIDWVIVGGESGHRARPMHPDWARSIRNQCVAAGVAFHFKQWGEHIHESQYYDMAEPIDPDRWMHICRNGFAKVGKHIAGRLLDGREWNQFPNTEETA